MRGHPGMGYVLQNGEIAHTHTQNYIITIIKVPGLLYCQVSTRRHLLKYNKIIKELDNSLKFKTCCNVRLA